jgi:predicted nucleotidyltransferase
MLKVLFSSQARIELLKLFLLNSSGRYYLRQIQHLTGQPLQAIQRETEKLAHIGLLEAERDGNRLYYSVNRSFPILPELKGIFLKTVGLGDALSTAINAREEIQVAFVFGSYAINQEDAQSDIDLCVIGRISSRKLHQVLAPVKQDLHRELNLVLFSAKEFCEKAADQNHFVQSLVKGPKMFIKGTEDELGRLAETGQATLS